MSIESSSAAERQTPDAPIRQTPDAGVSLPVGRVVATERRPNTAFEFHFWTGLDAPIGIGTIVRVDGQQPVNGQVPTVFGVVTEGFAYTDLQSPLHDVLGHD